MDALSGLYGFTGASDPTHLAVSVLIAFVLAGGLASLVLEVGRIAREYSGSPEVSYGRPAATPVTTPVATPKQAPKQAPKAPEKAPEKPAAAVPPKVEPLKPPVTPLIDVVKGTLKESVEALEKKYRLNAITLATADGLVIASTIKDPDEEAAVYSGKFNELQKEKEGKYYSLTDKGIYLYSAESSGNKVIGIARRTSALEQVEVAGLQDDTRKIVDKFAPSAKKP